MGLSNGCSLSADRMFAKRHTKQMETVLTNSHSMSSVVLTIDGTDCYMDLTYVRGDCTACTAYLDCLRLDGVQKMFTAIQEYMSISARISCMFTLKKHMKHIPDWIKALQQFPIAGLHVQKSNREPDSEYYMITGILKVPNPIVNRYEAFSQEYPRNHNNNDTTALNAINAHFGLQTF